MIAGIVLSANLGNFHPKKMAYLNSLADEDLAQLIHHALNEINPHIAITQEIGTFMDTVFGSDYEFIGIHDSIAVKKTFGRIVPNSFKSHTFHFKHVPNGPVYPDDKDLNAVAEHKLKLLKHPYDGNPDTPYGPPADFDIICVKLKLLRGSN